MAVVSVEIPDEIAKEFPSPWVISFEDFKEKAYDEEYWYLSLVDFWPEWMSKEDFEAYKSRR